MSNGPKFPGKGRKPAVRLNAKPTRVHRARKGELLDALRRKEADRGCEPKEGVMDLVHMSASSVVVDGLAAMLEATVGMSDYVRAWMPVEQALLVLYMARLAEDDPNWFPRGKWATIQAIESRIADEVRQAQQAARGAEAR